MTRMHLSGSLVVTHIVLSFSFIREANNMGLDQSAHNGPIWSWSIVLRNIAHQDQEQNIVQSNYRHE